MSRHREGEWWHIPILQEVLKCVPHPRTYVEIGVAQAKCFNSMLPLVNSAHGVDVNEESGHLMSGGTFYNMTSDEFFELYAERPPNLIFIDGDHTFKQVKRDFENADRIINLDGTIALHDTYGLNDPACGTAYKMLHYLDSCSCYNSYTFKAWPGLTLVTL